MSAAPCPRRFDLGPLVLGSLSPEERAGIEAHVATCTSCQAELAELAPLPGLLHRLTPAEAEWAGATPDLLPGLLARAAELTGDAAGPRDIDGTGDTVEPPARTSDGASSHVRRSGRRAAGWAAAGVAVAAGVSWMFAAGPLSGTEPAPTCVVVEAHDDQTGISGEVTLSEAESGTDLRLELSGVPAGSECQLVAVTADGSDVTASWDATYGGQATFTGSTHYAIEDIEKLLITTPDGETLLTMPMPT